MSVHEEAWVVHLKSGLSMTVSPVLRSLTTYVLVEQERWFEPEMSLLPKLLTRGMHTLDIGANHGVYALEMARCTGNGRVWAFEPTSAPRARLQRSVLSNGLQHRVTVVPAALAEAEGEASFAVHPNSELNSREGAGTEREHVQLLTLDGYLAAHAPGVPIGFVKLDAEGDELRVLEGAKQFFAAQSPVVMFEFTHGKVTSTPLVEAWHGLGYELFRWSAELELLLPFDAAHDELVFALNLLAVRPSERDDLAARGLLVTSAALAAEPPVAPGWLAPAALQAWCALPALQGVSAAAGADGGPLYERCLHAVAAAHLDGSLSPARRAVLMALARDTLQQAADQNASMGPAAWSLLVHVLLALGAQGASVQMGLQLLQRWPQGLDVDMPFVPPRRADLMRARTTTPGSWLRQMLAEHVEECSAHSSYFRPADLARLSFMLQHPDHSAEVERRYLLAHVRANRPAPLAGVKLLPNPAHTCNPQLWSGLMASMMPARTEPVAA